jgi:hypothetical protein
MSSLPVCDFGFVFFFCYCPAGEHCYIYKSSYSVSIKFTMLWGLETVSHWLLQIFTYSIKTTDTVSNISHWSQLSTSSRSLNSLISGKLLLQRQVFFSFFFFLLEGWNFFSRSQQCHFPSNQRKTHFPENTCLRLKSVALVCLLFFEVKRGALKTGKSGLSLVGKCCPWRGWHPGLYHRGLCGPLTS